MLISVKKKKSGSLGMLVIHIPTQMYSAKDKAEKEHKTAPDFNKL